MRLTLRTLLSYLDNVLDAPARAELEKQIESNENAGEWLHRTRDVMRRLKLGAPEIDGTNSVDDPNTVAEYLDRALPEESVAEFERVCLESDAMLAEVASCHHVLAMVLTDKPAVDPDTQKRLHRLQADLAEAMRSRVEQAHPSPQIEAAEPLPASSAAGEPLRVKRQKTGANAPDYLREGDASPLAKWAPAIAALLILGVTSVLAFRPGGWLNPTPEIAKVDPSVDAGTVTDPAVIPDEEESEPQQSEETPDPTEAVEEPTEPEATSEEETPIETPEEMTPEEPAVPAEPVAEPAGEGAPEAGPAEAEPQEPETTPAEEATPEEASVVPIRFISNPETLVVGEAEPGSWRRVMPGTELIEKTRLISMPTYRSRYELGGGVTLELVGLTQAAVQPAGGEAPYASIDLDYGRIVLRRGADTPAAEAVEGEEAAEPDPNAGKAEVVIAGIPYQATLGPNAVLAIAADRPFKPGHPILEVATPLVAMAHGLAGKIEWESDDVGLTTNKPRPWVIAGDENGQVPTSVSDPSWVDELKITPADGYASPELARAVQPELPIWPQLMQIAGEERFGEIRSLANRCSLPLGHPDRLVESFREAKEEAFWEANLSELRQAASRDTAQAGEVQRVFAEAFGERTSEELIDLLIGFEPEEVGLDAESVAGGVITEFVLPALQSEDLATRVLASLILKETIEPLDRPYKPLATTRSRLKATRWIESQLEKQELTPLMR